MSTGKSNRQREEELAARRAKLHMQRTPFSERVLPAILIALALLTLVLIILAVAILVGVAPWR